jgi:CheY-like chemotaxis protein
MNESPVTPKPAANADVAKPARKKILLADDDPALRQVLSRLLTSEGYIVQTAANGIEALDLANETEFDLVLLDLTMPGKDGWETFEQLSSKTPALPIILITARPNQLFSAMSAGVGALLEKPLDFDKLFFTIRALLEEAAEARLLRLAGRAAVFRYYPPVPKVPGNIR